MSVIDRKGVWTFLLLTFGLTFIYEGSLIWSGMSMSFGLTSAEPNPPVYALLLVAMAMWIPALSTVIVAKFITKERFGVTNFRFGTLEPYVVSALVMPAVFAIIYALTWLLGLAEPDWQLQTLSHAFATRGTAKMPDPRLVLPAIFFASPRHWADCERSLCFRRGARLARLPASQINAAGKMASLPAVGEHLGGCGTPHSLWRVSTIPDFPCLACLP